MHRIQIYLECDHKMLRASEKMSGYVKVMPDGQKRRWIGHPQTLTWHRATLLALYMALNNLEDNYECHIYSSDGYVMKQIEGGSLARWEEKGYKGKNGPIKDADLWHKVFEKMRYQKVIIHEGVHDYQERMQDMFDHLKEKAG